MENKIPTAEAVLEYLIPDCKTAMTAKQYENAITAIRMHGRHYVKAALGAAANKATVTPIDHEEISEGSFRPIWGVDDDSILNAYPLNLIK